MTLALAPIKASQRASRPTGKKSGDLVDEKIKRLVAQIGTLEDELEAALREREVPVFYHLNGKRIEFDDAVRAAHRSSRRGVLSWFFRSSPPTVLVAPVIYGLIVPLLVFDFGLFVYQSVCFPVYGIEKVKRSDYMSMDRWHLQYLNFIEKFNCAYCAYANGIIAYGTEIAARTEQYWCPIKHARKIMGTHARYVQFIRYGDAEDYPQRLEEFREALSAEVGRSAASDKSPS
jgi:hypothetical protein